MSRFAAALLVPLLAVFTMAAGEPPPPGLGSADTTLEVAQLSLPGLPDALDQLDLGEFRAYASSDTDPARNILGGTEKFALASLMLAAGQGTTVTSRDPDPSEAQMVPLPGGLGSVSGGVLEAVVEGDEVRSLVGGLDADVQVEALTLRARAAGDVVRALVQPNQAVARDGAVLSDFRLNLTDLLPPGLLDQLPLDTIIDLVEELQPDLGTLDPAFEALRDLADLLDETAAVQDAINQAQGELDELVAQLGPAQAAVDQAIAEVDERTGAVTAAQETVDEANAAEDEATDDAEAAANALEDAIEAAGGPQAVAELCDAPGGGAVCDNIADLREAAQVAQTAQDEALGALDDAEAALEAAEAALARATSDLGNLRTTLSGLQQAIDAAQALLDSLTQRLARLLNQLIDFLDGLDLDLAGLLEDLVEGLEDADLLAIDELSVGLQAVSTLDSSRATALCSVRGVTVLGQTGQVETCAQLADAITALGETIQRVLAALPVVGELVDGVVTVRGPALVTSPDNLREGPYSVAFATIRGLGLQVRPLNLGEVTDQLLDDATAVIRDTLDNLPDGVPTGPVTDAIDTLRETIDGLPTGDVLDGITLPGVDLEILNVAGSSSFRAAAAAQPTGVTPPPAAQPPAPAAPPPAQVAPAPAAPVAQTGPLPQTGSGFGALALVLLLGGGAAWAWLRDDRARASRVPR